MGFIHKLIAALLTVLSRFIVFRFIFFISFIMCFYACKRFPFCIVETYITKCTYRIVPFQFFKYSFFSFPFTLIYIFPFKHFDFEVYCIFQGVFYSFVCHHVFSLHEHVIAYHIVLQFLPLEKSA